MAKAVDKAPSVSVWARLNIRDVPITWTSDGREYNPDFLVVETPTSDGEAGLRSPVHWLVETKMNREMTSDEVQAKKRATTTWTNTVTSSPDAPGVWRYLLLSETNVAEAHGDWERLKAMGS